MSFRLIGDEENLQALRVAKRVRGTAVCKKKEKKSGSESRAIANRSAETGWVVGEGDSSSMCAKMARESSRELLNIRKIIMMM